MKTSIQTTTKEPAMKTTAKQSPVQPAAEAAPLSIESVKTLSGDALIEAHLRVIGEAPKPRTPVPVLRKRIIAELERRASVPAADAAVEPVVNATSEQAAAEVEPTIESAVAAEPADAEPATEQDTSSPVQGDEEDVLTAGAPLEEPVLDREEGQAAPAAGHLGAQEEPEAPVTADLPVIAPAKPKRARKPAEVTRPSTPEEMAAEAAREAEETPGAPKAPKARDPRLPAAGTVLTKKQGGAVVATATVQEDGTLLYNGASYKTTSAAAIACVKALGLTAKTTNGWTFWGIVKKVGKGGAGGVHPSLRSLPKAWERYVEVARAAMAAEPDAVRETVAGHREEIGAILRAEAA